MKLLAIFALLVCSVSTNHIKGGIKSPPPPGTKSYLPLTPGRYSQVQESQIRDEQQEAVKGGLQEDLPVKGQLEELPVKGQREEPLPVKGLKTIPRAEVKGFKTVPQVKQIRYEPQLETKSLVQEEVKGVKSVPRAEVKGISDEVKGLKRPSYRAPVKTVQLPDHRPLVQEQQQQFVQEEQAPLKVFRSPTQQRQMSKVSLVREGVKTVQLPLESKQIVRQQVVDETLKRADFGRLPAVVLLRTPQGFKETAGLSVIYES